MIRIDRSCLTGSFAALWSGASSLFYAGLLLVLKGCPYKIPYSGVECLHVGCCRIGPCAMLSDMAIESLACPLKGVPCVIYYAIKTIIFIFLTHANPAAKLRANEIERGLSFTMLTFKSYAFVARHDVTEILSRKGVHIQYGKITKMLDAHPWQTFRHDLALMQPLCRSSAPIGRLERMTGRNLSHAERKDLVAILKTI